MKYEKPKLVKLSDSSRKIVYGGCFSGDGAAGSGSIRCYNGPDPRRRCNAGGTN